MGRKKNETTALPTTGTALATNGEAIAALRVEGKTWDEIGRAVSGTDTPVSANRLRPPYRAFLATAEGERYATALVKAGKAREGKAVEPLAADGAAIVAARDGNGEGFPLLAARTGLSVGEVVALYVEAGGEARDGRIYVGAGGTRTYVGTDGTRRTLPPFSAKAARKRAKAGKADAAIEAVAAGTVEADADEKAAAKAAKKAERKAAKKAAKKAARKAAKAA